MRVRSKSEGRREEEMERDQDSRSFLAKVLTMEAGSLNPPAPESTPRVVTSVDPSRAPISPAFPLMIVGCQVDKSSERREDEERRVSRRESAGEEKIEGAYREQTNVEDPKHRPLRDRR